MVSAALYRSAAWFLFSGLVLLSYLPGESDAAGITLLRWIEYLPLYGMLVFEGLRRTRSRTGSIEGSREGVIASAKGSSQG